MSVSDATAMIAGMAPELDAQRWVFCTGGEPAADALCSFLEDEGLTQVLPLSTAVQLGHDVSLVMRRIILRVHSALDGVGLTAAVAGELARNGISCNMIAAYHHDHIFVPEAQAGQAEALLLALQSEVGKSR